MNRLTRFPLFVFDLSGTIIDTHCKGPLTFLKKAFDLHKVNVSEHDIIQDMGNAKKTHIKMLLDKHSEHGVNNSRQVDKIYKSYLYFQNNEIQNYCKLTQGTKEAFDLLKQKGVKIGITTGFDQESVMRVIVQQLHDQKFYPDSVQWSTQIAKRPMPDMINKIKTDQKIVDGQIAVKFDDCEIGLQEGRNAGCLTVGVYGTSAYTPARFAINKFKSADVLAWDVLDGVKKLL